jgi:hypothetical protein
VMCILPFCFSVVSFSVALFLFVCARSSVVLVGSPLQQSIHTHCPIHINPLLNTLFPHSPLFTDVFQNPHRKTLARVLYIDAYIG